MYKFSIITVVYNAKNSLLKTVKSINEQDYKNYEHIIIDGGSTDGTIVYLESLKYDNIRYISEKDSGIYDAMNKGINLSNGEYLLFLNAADTFASNDVLKNVANKIEQNTLILYGGANVYNENGQFLTSLKPFQLNKKNLNRYATRVVCHQSIFVNKNFVVPYSDKYRLKSELNWYYELLINIKNDRMVRIEDMICNYYLGGTGDKNFWENYFERIIVTKRNNRLSTFIANIPFFAIPLIFKIRRIFFGK